MREHVRQAGEDVALWFERRSGEADTSANGDVTRPASVARV